MQALKALVIIMGVLIVAGTAVVVVTIYNRMNRMADADGGAAAPSAPVAAPTPATFGAASVAIPDGCRVMATIPAGERLLLQLGSAPRCSRILVLDLGSGRLLGTIDLVPEN